MGKAFPDMVETVKQIGAKGFSHEKPKIPPQQGRLQQGRHGYGGGGAGVCLKTGQAMCVTSSKKLVAQTQLGIGNETLLPPETAIKSLATHQDPDIKSKQVKTSGNNAARQPPHPKPGPSPSITGISCEPHNPLRISLRC